ncbi:MAG: TIGR04150 pseudo-rSAM protein [Bacteroidales bacterium]
MKQKLTLYPDTFLWIKSETGLIYNSKYFTLFEFKVTKNISNLCSRLLEFSNLYTIEVDSSVLCEDEQKFINKIISSKCGKLSPADTLIISLPPLLNIQKDVNKLIRDKSRGIGEGVLKYFTSLTIQTGGEYKNNEYYKQTIYPAHTNDLVSLETLSKILEEYSTPYLSLINIVIPNLKQCFDINALLKVLKYYKGICILTPVDTSNSEAILRIINEDVKVKLIYDNSESIHSKSLSDINGLSYKFIIRNIKEYNTYYNTVQELDLNKYEMVPVFDYNMDFFEENVFLLKKDLIGSKLSRREVFIHQAINTNFFGNITIMPDCKVYSNVNCPAIGCITDSVYDIILHELENNYAWRLLRTKEPCNECVWQWMCPSPSNYEFIIGKQNICSIKQLV